MKNSIIIALHNNGLQEVSALTLSSASAYAVYKFKRAISKAVDAINEAQRGIVQQVGIEDLTAFSKRMEELSKMEGRTPEQEEELDGLHKKDLEAGRLLQELAADDTDLDVKLLSYEDWHALQVENKDCKALVHLEHLLEGVLWAAPEEG